MVLKLVYPNFFKYFIINERKLGLNFIKLIGAYLGA